MPRSSLPRLSALLLPACLLLASPAPAEEGDSSPDPGNIRLASVHAAIVDLESDDVLYRKQAHRVVPIASITKLMTAMVVLDSGQPLDDWLTIRERRHEAANNAFTHLRTGSQLPRGDLLRLALMASENHAAYNLARHHPGGFEAFVAAMNEKARSLGMDNTRFVDPSGLDASNRSTAADLLAMLQAAADYPKIREYTQTERFTARFRRPGYRLHYGNTNVLVYRDHWDVALSKTGYLDDAGRCLVMLTEIDGRPVGIVLLDSFGTRSPIGDAGRIRRWLETGSSGPVASAALRYEQRRRARYEQVSRSE